MIIFSMCPNAVDKKVLDGITESSVGFFLGVGRELIEEKCLYNTEEWCLLKMS